MQGGEASTPASPYGGGQRGAGGKLRRERKPPATPYDRPPRKDISSSNDGDGGGGGGGWLSRIVTPARRLISGGATRLLPSLFSPLPPLPPPKDDALSQEGRQKEDEREAMNQNENSASLVVVSESTGGIRPNEAKAKSVLHISDNDTRERIGNHIHGGLPDIEQLIKGKTFSREEIDRLMEILKSRVADAEQERNISSILRHEEVERAETSHERQIAFKDKEEQTDKVKWATPSPLPLPTENKVHNEICASPVDIARAYMGSRTSEVGFTSTSLVPRSDKFSIAGDLSTKPYLQSPLSKPPICWPGAMTQDQQGYLTPQSQKSRYGLQSFPRTPYSRTMYTKSKSKLTPLLGDSERFTKTPSTTFQPMRTSAYGKTRTNIAEESYGSGGPIRRVRNKSASVIPVKESAFMRTAQRSPFSKESNVDLMLKKKFEPGSSIANDFESLDNKVPYSELGAASVHPHSSKLARQILEQLDRPITLKEKSEELKFAASWKNSSQIASSSLIQNNSLQTIGGTKSTPMEPLKLSALTNGQRNVLPEERTDVITASKKPVSSVLDKATASSSGGPSSTIQKVDFQAKNADQAISNNVPKGNGEPWLFGGQGKAPNVTNNVAGSEQQNTQRKPILPSIAIEKPGLRASFPSDTSAGFTFPVTGSSSTSAEPPTRSIMPSSSPEQPKPSSIFPTTNFGNKITIAPPVIPIHSTSTVSTSIDTAMFKFGSGKTRLSFALSGDDASASPDDAAAPKFKFGSEKSRLSFASVGSDGVLC